MSNFPTRVLVAAAFVGAAILMSVGSAAARQEADTTSPTITSAPDITVPATADYGSTFTASVTFLFGVSDPDDAADQISVVCNNANGTMFFWGMTMVTCQAHDPAGNLSPQVHFTVTVTLPPPTFQNVPAPVTTQATGTFGAIVTFVPPTASDVGGQSVPVSCDHLSGIAYPIGTTTVTCTAQIMRNDSNGTPITGLPSATAQFAITVTPQGSTGGAGGGGGGGGGGGSGGGGVTQTDTTAPTLEPHPNVIVDAGGGDGATVTYTVAANDPDDATTHVTVACSPASGTTFPLAAHRGTRVTTVTCQARDSAGNVATPISFAVTVHGAHDQIVVLETHVKASSLARAQKTMLVARLSRAARHFRAGAVGAAIYDLGAFITAVNHLAAPLSHATRSKWNRGAARVIAVIAY